ncbi:MAG: hypothetical protein ACO1OB_06485 [Archangium sp.]
MTRGSKAGWLVGGAIVAIATLAIFYSVLIQPGFVESTLVYSFVPWISGPEAGGLFFIWIPLFLVAVSVWAALRGFKLKLPEVTTPPRTTVLAVSLLAALITLLLRKFVLRDLAFTDDERAYWFQAQALLHGRITGDPIAGIPLHNFAFHTVDGRVGMIYPLGTALLMAVGSVLGDPHLLQAICVGAIVGLSAVLAGQLQNRGPMLSVAIVTALSPTLLFTGATMHNVIPALLLTLLSLVLTFRFTQGGRVWLVLAAGLFAGLGSSCRTETALLAGIACTLQLFTSTSSWSERFKRIGLLAFGFALGLVPFLVATAAQTGSPFRGTYVMWAEENHPGARFMGFGTTSWGLKQTFESSIAKTWTAWLRIAEWWLGAPWLLLFAVLPLLRKKVSLPWLAPLSIVLGNAIISWLFMVHSVHDFGSAYHVLSVPMLSMLLMFFFPLRSPHRVRFAVANLVAVLFVFWPFAVLRTSHTADRLEAPLKLADMAAANHEKILVLTRRLQPDLGFTSWVYFPPPAPFPDEADIWWVTDLPAIRARLPELAKGRTVLALTYEGEQPVLKYVEPAGAP